MTRRADATKLSTLDLADLAAAIEAAWTRPDQDRFTAHDVAAAIAPTVEEIAGHAYDLGVETARRKRTRS